MSSFCDSKVRSCSEARLFNVLYVSFTPKDYIVTIIMIYVRHPGDLRTPCSIPDKRFSSSFIRTRLDDVSSLDRFKSSVMRFTVSSNVRIVVM